MTIFQLRNIDPAASMTWAYHYHREDACWSLQALGVPDMQQLEQGQFDSSIDLLPTTTTSTISFRDHCVIRLLEQVDMVIQRGIFYHKRNEIVQLYETSAPDRNPLPRHFPDLPDNQTFMVLLDPCRFCRMNGSVHQVTGKAEI